MLSTAPFFAGCADTVGTMGYVFFSPVSVASGIYSTAVDERGLDTQIDDMAIGVSIRARLQAENFVDALGVTIHSYAGNVFLMGEVSPDTRSMAVDIARETGGVRRVITHWFLPAKRDHLADLKIGAMLRASMIADTSLSSTQIDTYIRGGHVLLLGMVRSPGDAAQAVSLARDISGVRTVKSYLLF